MLIEWFVMLLGGAVAALVCGLKFKKWLLTAFSMVAFLVIAMQPNIEIVSGKVILLFREPLINIAAWVGAFISAIFTAIGFFNYVGSRRQP